MANYKRSIFVPTDGNSLWDGLSGNRQRTDPDAIVAPDGNDYLQLVGEIRRLQAALVDHESRIRSVE